MYFELLYIYITRELDLLLPTCDFDSNSTCSAFNRVSSAFFYMFCNEPTFLLEFSVCEITDGPV